MFKFKFICIELQIYFQMSLFSKFNRSLPFYQFTIGIIFFLSIYTSTAYAEEEYLPSKIQTIITNKGLAKESFAYSVVLLNPSDSNNSFNTVSWNANLPMNPASTIKLLTTISALDQLGPEYRYKTRLYLKGKIDKGLLEGHLYVKGYGDPKLVPESLVQLMEQLKNLGVNKIQADVTMDMTSYNSSVKDSAPKDGEDTKSYNVSPNPLLYSFQTISFNLTSNRKKVDISFTPMLANFKVANNLQTYSGECIDWKKYINLSFTRQDDSQWIANFDGKLPSKCSNTLFNVVSIPNDQFFKMGFIAAWESVGGKWLKNPEFQSGKVPNDTPLILEYAGTTLVDAVIDTNKYSNNVMARQIFLTPALEKTKLAVSTSDAIAQTQKWLDQNQLNMSELVLENGSGLSEIERISPRHMTDLLKYAASSKHNDIFVASLPIAGIDGTMRHRLVNQFKNLISHAWHENKSHRSLPLPEKLYQSGAYIKTGSLQQVRSIAGYVVSKTGQVYAISSMVNHPKASDGLSSINDALIIWLAEDGPLRINSASKNFQSQ